MSMCTGDGYQGQISRQMQQACHCGAHELLLLHIVVIKIAVNYEICTNEGIINN